MPVVSATAATLPTTGGESASATATIPTISREEFRIDRSVRPTSPRTSRRLRADGSGGWFIAGRRYRLASLRGPPRYPPGGVCNGARGRA